MSSRISPTLESPSHPIQPLDSPSLPTRPLDSPSQTCISAAQDDLLPTIDEEEQLPLEEKLEKANVKISYIEFRWKRAQDRLHEHEVEIQRLFKENATLRNEKIRLYGELLLSYRKKFTQAGGGNAAAEIARAEERNNIQLTIAMIALLIGVVWTLYFKR